MLHNYLLRRCISTCCLLLLTGLGVYAQNTVSGKVTSTTDQSSLPGVTILVKGTSIGTISDKQGNYSIKTPSGNDTLVFRYLGYTNRFIAIGDKSTINVKMELSSNSLQDVVVVGYGTQKKVDVTGSISTVSGKAIQESPVANLTNALAGRVSGVLAVNGNGRPGSGSSLEIRGLSTLNNNSPLVVVDGIVQDDFDNIDPTDIESISILKDAASTAVYGARAANGVFLITTKRGKTGKPVITYNGRVGIQQPTQYPQLMSGYQYAKLKNQALKNSGVPASSSQYYTEEQLQNFKQGEGTVNWYKATFKKNSMVTQHNLSIRGGSKAIKYFGSIGYVNQDGMYDEINFKRYNFRSNIDARISNSLSLSIDLSGNEHFSNTSGYDANAIFREVTQTTNLLPGAYWPDGLPVNTSGQNPAAMINSSGYSAYDYDFFKGIISLDLKLSSLIKGLSLKGTVSITQSPNYIKWFQTPYASYDENENGSITNTKVNGGDISLDEYYTQEKQYTGNISLNYKKSIHKHNITALFLAENHSDYGNTFTAHKQDFPTALRDDFSSSGPSNQSISGNNIINDFRESLVGRLNYAYADKYLLEASFRYDGSYRFPKGHRFGLFPAISLGWVISDEPFFKKSEVLKFVNNLKLRASRGEIGNDRVAPFQFQDAYSIVTNAGPIMGGQALSLINYGVYPNPDITWERQESNDIGLESSFFDSKFGFQFDYFSRVTKDILWTKTRSIPATFGRSLPSANYAMVSSHGLEFTLNYRNTIGSVNYNLNLISSYATNKVTRIDDPANALDYQKQLGRPIGYVAGFDALGIFQSQEEADKWYGGYEFGQKAIAGDIKYADVDGDGEITQNDQKILSNHGGDPAIVFGFSGGVKWKGFDLGFLIQGAAKRTLLLSGYGRQAFRSGGATGTFAYLIDSWSPDNKDAKYPIAELSPRSVDDRTSDIWLRKAAYARLKSVNLGYTFKSSLLNKYIKTVRIYVSGLNLYTWSQEKEFDPEAEVGTGSYYPQQKNMNVGINLSF